MDLDNYCSRCEIIQRTIKREEERGREKHDARQNVIKKLKYAIRDFNLKFVTEIRKLFLFLSIYGHAFYRHRKNKMPEINDPYKGNISGMRKRSIISGISIFITINPVY